MRCPTLDQLPPPPPEKTGWPWTEESPQLPDTMPDGLTWPRISIVTPSYNQCEFIEETIRSVLLQGYPNLEYIIMDGGSTDESVEMIKKYEPWISYWVSKRDNGQPNAINTGFEKATGEIIAWINSDDYYYPGALERVGNIWSPTNRDTFWIVAGVEYKDLVTGQFGVDYQQPSYRIEQWVDKETQMNQQGVFFSRSMFDAVGKLDETLQMGFDREYWVRMIAKGYRYHCETSFVAGCYRLHGACKGKKSLTRMRYEQTMSLLRYLPNDSRQSRLMKTSIEARCAYYLIRLSQDGSNGVIQRLRLLTEAIYRQPAQVLTRTFWGSVARILIPGYQRIRDETDRPGAW